MLVVAVLGGGGFLLVKALTSKSGNTTTHQGSGNNSTPGAGSTPGGSTGKTQTLDNINRQAIYAGVNITIISAKQAASLPERQESDPKLNALELQIKASNQTPESVYPSSRRLLRMAPRMNLRVLHPAGFSVSWGSDSVGSGSLFFDVPQGSKIGDFKVQIGSAQDALVTVPLTGTYDATQWQQVTHQVGQTVTYDNGQIKGTVTQIVVGTWSPGYQAPKDMRFLLMYLHVTNNTAFSIGVGDGTSTAVSVGLPEWRSEPAD